MTGPEEPVRDPGDPRGDEAEVEVEGSNSTFEAGLMGRLPPAEVAPSRPFGPYGHPPAPRGKSTPADMWRD